MQSHTYKFGTESFNTLSIAYKRFPFRGCCEFLTIGLMYCMMAYTKQHWKSLQLSVEKNKTIYLESLDRISKEIYLFYNKSHQSSKYNQLDDLTDHPTLSNACRAGITCLQTKCFDMKTKVETMFNEQYGNTYCHIGISDTATYRRYEGSIS